MTHEWDLTADVVVVGYGAAGAATALQATEEGAQGEVTVRWAYEVIGPALAGAVVLAILLAVG